MIIKKKKEILDHSPVDDAMPERLPQARLTITGKSSGLMPKENISIVVQPNCTKQETANITPQPKCSIHLFDCQSDLKVS